MRARVRSSWFRCSLAVSSCTSALLLYRCPLTPGAQSLAPRSRTLSQVRLVDGGFLLHPMGPYKTAEELWDDGEPTEPPPATLATAELNTGAHIPLVRPR